MEIQQYIKDVIDDNIKAEVQVNICGIDYYFERKELYKKFRENHLVTWTSKLSKRMIEAFKDNNFKIYVVAEIIHYGENKADGTCLFSPKREQSKINTLIMQLDDNPLVFYHEFGHFIDYCMAKEPLMFSCDGTIRNIILKEASMFGHVFVENYKQYGFCRNEVKHDMTLIFAQATYFLDTREYFAESFAIYLMNPKMLVTLCPLTYVYIDSIYRSLF